MVTTLYEQYLFVIGKLKDTYKLDIEVDHRDIHTFYKDKRPLFKLFYGMFTKEDDPSIVVSFHIDMYHPEAIQWFINIYSLHPLIKMHDSYIDDSNGETYLGEDAVALQEMYRTQQVLEHYLENHDTEEIRQVVDSKIVGRHIRPTIFDSQMQRAEAIIEFNRLGKPSDDDEVQ